MSVNVSASKTNAKIYKQVSDKNNNIRTTDITLTGGSLNVNASADVHFGTQANAAFSKSSELPRAAPSGASGLSHRTPAACTSTRLTEGYGGRKR